LIIIIITTLNYRLFCLSLLERYRVRC